MQETEAQQYQGAWHGAPTTSEPEQSQQGRDPGHVEEALADLSHHAPEAFTKPPAEGHFVG